MSDCSNHSKPTDYVKLQEVKNDKHIRHYFYLLNNTHPLPPSFLGASNFGFSYFGFLSFRFFTDDVNYRKINDVTLIRKK